MADDSELLYRFSQVTYELYYDPALSQGESNGSLARIESRIRQLEEFLGPMPLTTDAEQLDSHRGTFPLSEAISKVRQQNWMLTTARNKPSSSSSSSSSCACCWATCVLTILFDRSKLEQRVSLLDDAHIEVLKQKIPALKVELDAINQNKMKVFHCLEHCERVCSHISKLHHCFRRRWTIGSRSTVRESKRPMTKCR